MKTFTLKLVAEEPMSAFPSKTRLTQRAVDGGDSPRFLASCWLWAFSVLTASRLSTPPPLTQTVSPYHKKSRLSWKTYQIIFPES